MNKFINTWIAFHGITDILLPIYIWFPIYSISTLSIFIPINILNLITIITSAFHFSQDIIYLNYIETLSVLLILLYYGEYKLSQNIMISYMSLIHTPLHLYNINFNYINIIILFSTYIIFYNINILQNILKIIINSGGRLPNNNYHKLLLGIINAHILTNIVSI
jgi:hypothetical protein